MLLSHPILGLPRVLAPGTVPCLLTMFIASLDFRAFQDYSNTLLMLINCILC